MNSYRTAQAHLHKAPKTWLITGAAGFIGSNLLEALLRLDQHVVGLDNFETGYKENLSQVRDLVTQAQWARFNFHEGDIRSPSCCAKVVAGADYVLHQAALGSVPRSLKNPIHTNDVNITGFLNMLLACKDAKVHRFVYAASSSTYGDHSGLPKVENEIGRPLSPYAVTKYVNELYAETFARCYGTASIGLRYFNVFGPRQDPDGPYSAVIPKWYGSMLRSEPIFLNGDGETSRDFCFVENVVQANILAAVTQNNAAVNQVYNVAVGERTTLKDLFCLIRERVIKAHPTASIGAPILRPFRDGDVRHSHANIGKISALLGYNPTHKISDGLDVATDFYVQQLLGLKNEKIEAQNHGT